MKCLVVWFTLFSQLSWLCSHDQTKVAFLVLASCITPGSRSFLAVGTECTCIVKEHHLPYTFQVPPTQN